jgi:hypothetical protein
MNAPTNTRASQTAQVPTGSPMSSDTVLMTVGRLNQ